MLYPLSYGRVNHLKHPIASEEESKGASRPPGD